MFPLAFFTTLGDANDGTLGATAIVSMVANIFRCEVVAIIYMAH